MANTLSATTAVAVEELAAQMEITTNKLRLAIGLAAAAKYTVDLGLGIRVKVAILDEAHLCDEAVLELARVEGLDFRDSRQIFMKNPAASEQHQGRLRAPPASARIQ